jgi:hypothetical protein
MRIAPAITRLFYWRAIMAKRISARQRRPSLARRKKWPITRCGIAPVFDDAYNGTVNVLVIVDRA